MSDRLAMNQVMRTGEYLVSANGAYIATLQDDGNFCVYKAPAPSAESYVWGSQVAPGPGTYLATMQSDGHFCVYSGTVPTREGFVWGTPVVPGEGSYMAIIQDDGNFCVYRTGMAPKPGFVWGTGLPYNPQPHRTDTAVCVIFHNRAALDVEFRVRWVGGYSGWTGRLSLNQSATIRVDHDPNVPPPGITCWAEVNPFSSAKRVESQAGFSMPPSVRGASVKATYYLDSEWGMPWFQFGGIVEEGF